MTPTPAQTAVLVGVSLLAGTVDAVAGGGGLLTLPALLFFGLPPHLALGTNKGQSVFGSGAALARFTRAGMVDGRLARVGFPLGLLGSYLGASLVLVVSPAALRPVVLGLLVAAAAFVALRPLGGAPAARVPARFRLAAAGGIALALGTYDGFFGPGMGTLLLVAYFALLGTPLARASADAKVVNFASNLAAVSVFAWRGTVLWRVALPMAAAQLAGGWLGAHLTVRGGDRVVRWLVLVVVLALVGRLVAEWV